MKLNRLQQISEDVYFGIQLKHSIFHIVDPQKPISRNRVKRKQGRQRQGHLSPKKQRAFFTIVLLFPLLFFGLLEISLRLFGYGPDLSLFVTEELAGETYHVMNAAVKNRYFPSVPFNPTTSPDYFAVPKPEGTYRIFCLGGSTTVGYPYWYNGSFSSFLRDRLRAIFPERNIEIVNVGMTATNSFTVNDMARELVLYEPDLFVVYDGHNEFYGALGVASHESIAQSRWMTKLYLRLIHFKTFQLLQDAVTSVTRLFSGNDKQPAGSTMMEKLARGQYIPYGSTLYRAGLSTFQENLIELSHIGSEAGVSVLLGSQVSNLRDMPPFVSEDSTSGAGLNRNSEFRALFQRGITLWNRRVVDSALVAFTAASAIDTLRADAYYQIARCLDYLGRKREAERLYMKARDYDMLRFRMSSDFNSAMKLVSDERGMVFVDMEQAFRSHSTDSLIGNRLIVEHLHPHSRGFFIMAKEYARAMREGGFLATRKEWLERDTISDSQLWNNRCVTEIDERIAHRRTEILTSGWPFQDQTPIVTPIAPGDTLGQIADFVTRAQWNWLQAHDAAADYYLARKDWNSARQEYRTIINQLPLVDVQPYLKLARISLQLGDLKEAKTALLGSLTVEKTILAYRALGDIALEENAPEEAIPYYEKAMAFSSGPADRIDNGYMLALALSRSNLKQRATAELINILKLRPDHQRAAELLAKLNEQR